ncbi:MAG TPA: hypothetical protein VKK79_26330 [Candidatus Lokiarchaeia archaeon]|nr:hypothetical protein [Candidatus Lokiarchaeia archaeon]
MIRTHYTPDRPFVSARQEAITVVDIREIESLEAADQTIWGEEYLSNGENHREIMVKGEKTSGHSFASAREDPYVIYPRY